VDLEAEAGGETVGEHPLDEEAGIEGGVVGGALVRGVLEEGGGEKDFAAAGGEAVGVDEVAGELVVGAIGEDEFYFVVGGEGFEVFDAEGVGGSAGAGTLYVDDFMDRAGHGCEGLFAAGLDHEGVIVCQEAVHEGQELACLEHGFAAGELDEATGGESFDLGEDFVGSEGLAAGEGVLGVAPGAAEVAAGEADEDAGDAGEGAFALHGFVELDEVHYFPASGS